MTVTEKQQGGTTKALREMDLVIRIGSDKTVIGKSNPKRFDLRIVSLRACLIINVTVRGG